MLIAGHRQYSGLLEIVEFSIAIDRRRQPGWRSFEQQIHVDRFCPDRIQGAIVNMDDKSVTAEPEADARIHVPCPFRSKHGAEGHHDRGRAERQRRIMTRMAGRPAAQHLDQFFGFRPPFGQFIDLYRSGRRQSPFPYNPVLLQLTQSLRQDVGAHPRQITAQFAETPRPEHQFTHDQDGPPLTNQFERKSRPARIVIPSFSTCFSYLSYFSKLRSCFL